MDFVLSTDSSCDNFKSVFKDLGVEYFSMKYNYNDQEFEDNFNSNEDYDNFYKLQDSGILVKTSGVNVAEMTNYFQNLMNKYNTNIIHFSLSSGLSCTYQNSCLAAEEINEKSEHKIYIVDSLSATVGINHFLNEAIKLRDENKTTKETLAIIHNMIARIGICFFVNDLETLKKGGRISPVVATIGKAMKLKPILSFDDEGKLSVIGKVIGERKAVLTLLNKIAKEYDGKSDFEIVYGNNETLIELFKTQLEKTYPNAKINKYKVGPMIAAHTGPSLIGVVYTKK